MSNIGTSRLGKNVLTESKFGFLPANYYLIFFAIVIASSFLGVLPGGWLGGFTFCTLTGLMLEKVGDNTPIIKDYLGGGAIVMIFGGAVLVYLNIFPEKTLSLVETFVKDMDYIGWVVGALICGSILSMDRKLLVRAGALYFIPTFAGIILALGLAGIAGQLMGFGWRKAILFIAVPIMGGGTSAGAVPTSQIYGELMSQDAGYYLSLLMPAVALGNALAIVTAGLLNKIGSAFPNVTGNGTLMKNFEVEEEGKETIPDYQLMGIGFIITGVFFAIGKILSMMIPAIHYYAWTIISVGVVKILGVFPEELEPAVTQWYKFLLKISIPAVLMGIGMVYTDLSIVIESFSLQYFILVLVTMIGAVLGSWFAGHLVGFYPLESSLTAGLCMANMGGSGDIATLGAARRMELMPFAQISSRIGGAIMLIIASILASTLGQIL